MSDKHLSVPEWKKKFAKGHELKDAPLLKALAAFESAKDAEARLAALDEIEKQAELLHKASKADKEVTAYLDEARKAAAKERRLAEAEVEAAEDEEEDSPALLTTALLPLLRQVRKGAAMKAMVALAGKGTAVLLAKRSIAPARRKLLQEYLGGGAAKFATGECVWEENAHTFVLQTAAAGLAKKIRAALLEQTNMRVKVRVRGESPDDIDDDGEAPEHEEEEANGAPAAAAAAASEPAPAQAAHDTHEADAAAFNARLAALMPRIKDALTAAGPSAGALKSKISDAGTAARSKDFVRAGALLDEAEKLTAGSGAATTAALADWHARRDGTVVSLKGVAGKVAAARHASSAKAILELQAVITKLGTVPATAQQAGELQHWLETDGIVEDLCELAEDIRTPLLASLARLRAQLAA